MARTLTRASRLRAWYGGRQPADPEFLRELESGESDVHILYTLEDGEEYGAYADVVGAMFSKIARLVEDRTQLRGWSPDEGFRTLLEALVDFASSPEELVLFLRQSGGFGFAKGTDAEAMKVQVNDVFEGLERDSDPDRFVEAASSLEAIWSPQPGHLLDLVVSQPADAFKLIAARLNPATARYLGIIGHTFQRVRRSDLEPLASSQTAAYVRGSEIHLLVGVREMLEEWEERREERSDGAHFTLLETLLLHEVAEVLLREETPRIEPLTAHIIAAALERYLSGTALAPAIDNFFQTWLPSVVVAERCRPERVVQGRRADSEGSLVDRTDANADLAEHVLVVEDSTMIRRTICQIVKELGVGTLEAEDGKSGLEAARRQSPDLVILDLLMPGMDGVEMLKQMRADRNLVDVDVIVLSSVANKDVIRQALGLGVKDYLVKPLVPNDVKSRVLKYLGPDAQSVAAEI